MDLEKIQSVHGTDVRLSHLVGLLYSAHHLGMWCISPRSRHLFFCSIMHENELLQVFEKSGCFDYALQEGSTLGVPFIMSDALGLVWLAEYATIDVGVPMLVLVGPAYPDNAPYDQLDGKLRRMVFDGTLPSDQLSTYRTVLKDIPVIPAQTLVSCGKMLHFSIYQKLLRTGDIHYQKTAETPAPAPAEGAPARDRSWVDYSQIHSQEQLILQCVREGNLNYMQLLNEMNYHFLDLPLSEDPFRSELYKVVTNIALCCRAAIEGGLSPKIALGLENDLYQRADHLKKVTDLRAFNLTVMDSFIRAVHEAKTQTGISQPIQECCKYITSHLTEDLTIDTLARQVGYTEYYLSRKFYKEVGVHLTDYIKDARLEYAKVCLLSTNLSIEEISDSLHFTSRNYFTKVFRQRLGNTPTEFRAMNGG